MPVETWIFSICFLSAGVPRKPLPDRTIRFHRFRNDPTNDYTFADVDQDFEINRAGKIIRT